MEILRMSEGRNVKSWSKRMTDEENVCAVKARNVIEDRRCDIAGGLDDQSGGQDVPPQGTHVAVEMEQWLW
jgi:hypothetical protein